MNFDDLDLTGGNQGGANPPADSTTNPPVNNQNDDATHLDGGGNPDITGKDGNNPPTDVPPADQSNDSDLVEGDTIEYDGTTYTVDKGGNLVDANGSIFKEASQVNDWLKSMNVQDGNEGSEEGLTVTAIQDALGVTVTDSEGNTIEFTNDAEGVKAYVNSVIDLKSSELQQAAINKLYADNPLLKQFNDYVAINGTARGFGELPDRSGIQIDAENVAQQVAIIKMAAAEFGNKSLTDSYINYLKDSGGLYDEARAQLSALVEKDAAVRQDIEQRAAAKRQQDFDATQNYWKNVNNVINSRVIAGYKLPESFTKEVNGQKLVLTPNDFYKYLSKAESDADGNQVTAYQRDLAKLTDEEYLNRELLDAWLMFTGGSYKDLIDMAVKEDKVRQLRVTAKEQRTAKAVKVMKKSTGKVDLNDIIL
jgi:hypothetical protein